MKAILSRVGALVLIFPAMATGDSFQLSPFMDISTIPAGIAANFTEVRCVAVDSAAEEIHALHLGLPPIVTFDTSTGRYLRGWGTGLVEYPHGCDMRSSSDDSSFSYVLWVADGIKDADTNRYGDFTVRVLDTKAESLVRVIGTSGQEGTGVDPLQFSEVTDVAFTPGGDGKRCLARTPFIPLAVL